MTAQTRPAQQAPAVTSTPDQFSSRLFNNSNLRPYRRRPLPP
jgi:hypothetical protein